MVSGRIRVRVWAWKHWIGILWIKDQDRMSGSNLTRPKSPLSSCLAFLPINPLLLSILVVPFSILHELPPWNLCHAFVHIIKSWCWHLGCFLIKLCYLTYTQGPIRWHHPGLVCEIPVFPKQHHRAKGWREGWEFNILPFPGTTQAGCPDHQSGAASW